MQQIVVGTGQIVHVHGSTKDGRTFLLLGDALLTNDSSCLFELVGADYVPVACVRVGHNDPQDPPTEYIGVQLNDGLLVCSINMDGKPWRFNGRLIKKFDWPYDQVELTLEDGTVADVSLIPA
jgi:hypothetical protein